MRNSVLSSPTWRIGRPEKFKKIRLKDDESSALNQAINLEKRNLTMNGKREGNRKRDARSIDEINPERER